MASSVIRGQYQFLEKLGSGGMGDVYRARDIKLNRFVAVKILTAEHGANPQSQQRFIQEAQAASALNHPNIIVIYDVISEGGADYMVMEYVAGKTLADLIPRGGLRVHQAIKYGVQIADGLAAAHAAGIIHRDLKPGNIMVSDQDRVKLLDFGLAKLATPELTNDPDATAAAPLTVMGAIMGTLSYMSPEQAQGKYLDARSDIFSFGAVLYEMATGQRAFSGDNSVSVLSAVLRDEPRRASEITPDVPAALETVIERCLRKNPDDRYQSMTEVYEQLSHLKQNSDSGVLYRPPSNPTVPPASLSGLPPPPTVAEVPAKPAKRRRGLAAVAVLVCILGVGAVLFYPKKAPPVSPPVPAVSATSDADKPSPMPNPATEPAAPSQPPLNADQVIDMVRAKVATASIVQHVRASKHTSLSDDDVIKMVRAGVPTAVIDAMRGTAAAQADQAPEKAVEAEKPVPAGFTLPEGTPVKLTLAEDVAADVEDGTSLRFNVIADVTVSGAVAIPAGSVATGTVVGRAKKKFLGVGRGIRLLFEFGQLTAKNGVKVPLRATSVAKPDGASRALQADGNKDKTLAAPKGTPFIAYTGAAVSLQP